MNSSNLKEIIIAQAKYFLEEMEGEFYPFGTIINNQGEIKPMSVYWGEEYPKSQSVIERLDDIIKKGVSNGEYLSGAIGIDVNIVTETNDGEKEKKSALEIREYTKQGVFISQFLYFKKEKEYFFIPSK